MVEVWNTILVVNGSNPSLSLENLQEMLMSFGVTNFNASVKQRYFFSRNIIQKNKKNLPFHPGCIPETGSRPARKAGSLHSTGRSCTWWCSAPSRRSHPCTGRAPHRRVWSLEPIGEKRGRIKKRQKAGQIISLFSCLESWMWRLRPRNRRPKGHLDFFGGVKKRKGRNFARNVRINQGLVIIGLKKTFFFFESRTFEVTTVLNSISLWRWWHN